jgi:3-isopropylmalate/(R)-2-methylmalate dehydratase small subunit
MGRVWKLGHNVSTDHIIPGRYNLTTDPLELAKYCLCEARPDFSKGVRQGDIIVAGRNFGMGSSREHAPIAIKAAGVAAVIAASFARIFYRNAINIGLPILVAPQVYDAVEDGDQVEVDLAAGLVHLGDGRTIVAEPLPPFVMEIVRAGGIVNLVRQLGRLPVGDM